MAWHESTQRTKAQIITLELDPKMIAASRRTFDKYRINDRVTLIEGPANKSLETLSGTFDIIFVDANKDGYESYVKQILDKKLLAPQGLIMCDNGQPLIPHFFSFLLVFRCNADPLDFATVFARGMTISAKANPSLTDKERVYWTANGVALRRFNTFCKSEPRIDHLLLPVYDGVSLIKWKQ